MSQASILDHRRKPMGGRRRQHGSAYPRHCRNQGPFRLLGSKTPPAVTSCAREIFVLPLRVGVVTWEQLLNGLLHSGLRGLSSHKDNGKLALYEQLCMLTYSSSRVAEPTEAAFGHGWRSILVFRHPWLAYSATITLTIFIVGHSLARLRCLNQEKGPAKLTGNCDTCR